MHATSRCFLAAVLTIGATNFTASFAATAEPAAADATAETRSIMAKIFSSLTDVLPLSINQEQFVLPENKERILTDLRQLRDGSKTLVEHTSKFEGSYGFIANSMARDLRDIYTWYDRGSTSEARYLLQQVSENCISCHMKLPDPGHAPKMDAFFKDVNISKLSLPERARMQVALRQFDDAMKTWEDMFATWAKPSELFAMDALSEYLKVAIRVKNDPTRALKTLTMLTKRTDLPKFMMRESMAWKNSLARLAPEATKTGNELNRASKIIQAARRTMEYPLDRTGLVDFIFASGMLNRFLATKPSNPDQKAEAYYLLGITEALIGRSTWLTQTDFYLEAAIRTAPKSKYARIAFDTLEQQILLENAGSGGVHIPSDIQGNLEELRGLISPSGNAK